MPLFYYNQRRIIIAKIAGKVYEQTRVIVINESDWTIEYNSIYDGECEITDLSDGAKTVIAQVIDNYETNGHGHVWPIAE